MGYEDWPEAFVLVDRNDKGAFSIRFAPENSETRNTEIAMEMITRGNIDKGMVLGVRKSKRGKGGEEIEVDEESKILIEFLNGEICFGCLERMPEIREKYEFGVSLKSDSD